MHRTPTPQRRDHRTSPARSALAPRPGRPRSEKAHQAILTATLELLAEAGVPELSIEGVAARAGVGKRTIYRRWPSKLPLILDAIATLPTIRVPATGTFRGDLVQMIHYFERVLRSSPLGGVLFHVAAGSRRDRDLDEAIGRYLAQRRAPMLELMQRGIDQGKIAAGSDPQACADVFSGAILNRLFFSRLPLDDAFVEHVLSTVLTGRRQPRRFGAPSRAQRNATARR